MKETPAKQAATQANTDIDPFPILKYRGVLKDHERKRLTTATGVLFAIYEQKEGGAPVWMEVQNVQPDQRGRFNAMVGSTKNEGIPAELFDREKPRWLGMQVLLPGEVEQRRVRLENASDGLRTTRLNLPDSGVEGTPESATAALSSNQSSQPAQSEQANRPRRTHRRLQPLPAP